MGRLDGKVALVTGAGGRLGRAHAMLLAKAPDRALRLQQGSTLPGRQGSSAHSHRWRERGWRANERAQAGGRQAAGEKPGNRTPEREERKAIVMGG